jgi:two-component system chemotaxis response regulator CheY
MSQVLIVDDAVFMRRMLREIITDGGLEVVGEAADGDEAIEQARALKPTLITMDVVMPNRSGVSATREIMAEFPNTRIVMVSAMGQESMILEAMEAGACDYIVKPFRKEEVVDTLKRALARK